ncbi:hypothetical protein C8Q74DRAFT_706894 [Fomes fomentarius]|nr:hypothetical protein C8Q74DRAFT_706894 [Fomes fomentarius]
MIFGTCPSSFCVALRALTQRPGGGLGRGALMTMVVSQPICRAWPPSVLFGPILSCPPHIPYPAVHRPRRLIGCPPSSAPQTVKCGRPRGAPSSSFSFCGEHSQTSSVQSIVLCHRRLPERPRSAAARVHHPRLFFLRQHTTDPVTLATLEQTEFVLQHHIVNVLALPIANRHPDSLAPTLVQSPGLAAARARNQSMLSSVRNKKHLRVPSPRLAPTPCNGILVAYLSTLCIHPSTSTHPSEAVWRTTMHKLRYRNGRRTSP